MDAQKIRNYCNYLDVGGEINNKGTHKLYALRRNYSFHLSSGDFYFTNAIGYLSDRTWEYMESIFYNLQKINQFIISNGKDSPFFSLNHFSDYDMLGEDLFDGFFTDEETLEEIENYLLRKDPVFKEI